MYCCMYLFITRDTGILVDPNTLNLDPDAEFWPKMDPDPGLYVKF